jgi:HK97 family phage major capsid protein
MNLDEAHEAILAEVKGIGGEHARALDAFRDELDAVKTALSRLPHGGGGGPETKAAPTLEQKAFSGYLRRGVEALKPAERKAIHVGDDSRGGFLAPNEFRTELLRALREASPVRRLARNLETSAGVVEFPVQVGGAVARWVGELEPRTESELAFDTKSIPCTKPLRGI